MNKTFWLKDKPLVSIITAIFNGKMPERKESKFYRSNLRKHRIKQNANDNRENSAKIIAIELPLLCTSPPYKLRIIIDPAIS